MQTYHKRFWPLLSLIVAAVVPVKAENGITSEQADRIISELSQIKALLVRPGGPGQMPSPPPERPKVPVKLDLTATMVLGPANAPVTVVEFTDFQCPFCNRFYADTFSEFKKNFIDTGKVRFYSRDLPLDFHPNAMQAALAARCAAEQGQFWTMRDWMSANPTKLDLERLMEHAQEISLDPTVFRSCVESGKYRRAVENDIAQAGKIGVTGTPAFVIGKSTPEGIDGELILGAMPYRVFEQKLKDLMK